MNKPCNSCRLASTSECGGRPCETDAFSDYEAIEETNTGLNIGDYMEHPYTEDVGFTSCKKCDHFISNKHDAIECEHSDCSRIERFDWFKHKEPEWHSRLWEGCPVIIKSDGLITDNELTVFNNFFDETMVQTNAGYTHKRYIRLPTIEESPRNVWLLHDGSEHCPIGAELLRIKSWSINASEPVDRVWAGEHVHWKEVDKFMIIDKEKFNVKR